MSCSGSDNGDTLSRSGVIVLGCLLLCGCGTTLQSRLESRFAEVAAVGRETDAKLEQIIIPGIDFDRVPLREVLDFLAAAAASQAVRFDIDYKLPREPVVEPEEDLDDFALQFTGGKFPLITFTARRISLKEALKITCEVARMGCSLEGNVVHLPADGAALRRATFECFDELYRLGLPDVSQAEYVQLRTDPPLPGSAGLMAFVGPITNGGAWNLGSSEAGRTRFLVRDYEVMEVEGRAWDVKTDDELWDALGGPDRKPPVKGKVRGAWRDANLARDVERVMDTLYETHRPDDAARERLFMFAAHLARRGEKEAAWRVARPLYGLSGKHMDLAESAVTRLADAKYGEAYRNLWRTGATNEFVREVESLADRFGEAWRHAASARRQVASLRKPRDLSKLDPAQQAFVRHIDAGEDISHGRLWLLNEPPDDDEPVWVILPSGILYDGIAAMPFLLSLLDDYTPVNRRWTDDDGLTFELGDVWSDRAPFFNGALSRPVTRAEVVMRWLRKSLWLSLDEQNDLGIRDGDEFEREKAVYRKWYKKRRRMTRAELAGDQLRCSFGEPEEEVIRILVPEGNAADMALIEKKLLREASRRDVPNCEVYARLRGEAARAFVDRYETVVMERVEEQLQTNLKWANGGGPKAGERRTEVREDAAHNRARAKETVDRVRADLESGAARLESIMVPGVDFRGCSTLDALETLAKLAREVTPGLVDIDITRVRKASGTPSFSGKITFICGRTSLYRVLTVVCTVTGLEWEVGNGKVVVGPAKAKKGADADE